ncbi:MAG: RNA 2',3'-cyclic phosphodiesterase [Acidiferrobacteraceae bacterium]
MSPVRRRVFFAIRPEHPADLAAIWEQASARGHPPVPIENAHMTLLFLGNVEASRLPEVIQAASGIEGGRFCLRLDHVGFWPGSRILWIGPCHPPAALLALERQLRAVLEDADLVLPDTPYCPHVTVSRQAASVVDFHGAAIVWDVRRFFLMESRPARGGVRYSSLREFQLGSPLPNEARPTRET